MGNNSYDGLVHHTDQGMWSEHAFSGGGQGAGEAAGSTMNGRDLVATNDQGHVTAPGGPADTSPLRGRSLAGVHANENSSAAIEQAAGNRKNPSFAGAVMQGPSVPAPQMANSASEPDENSLADPERKAAIRNNYLKSHPSDNMASPKMR